MRKITLMLSTLLLVAMVLAACGSQETATSAPSTSVSTMEEPTSAATSTEAAPMGTGTVSPGGEGTGTPGVPVTGEENPSRISNQLDYTVWNQDGEQIGEVNDMVLDLDNASVSYVIVGTGGFLDIGERDILVPWNSLLLQTGGGDMTGGEQNAFILQTDQDVFTNSPDMDVNSILPALGEPAGDWDAEIRSYWEGGGSTGTGTTGTSVSPSTTGTPGTGTSSSMTATPSTGTGSSMTSTPSVVETASPSAGTGRATTDALQGVVLATEVLGSNITVGMNGVVKESPGAIQPSAQGTGTPGLATAMPAVTGTPSTSVTGTGTPSTSTGTGTTGEMVSATIEDLIVDTDSGDIQYVVVNSSFDDGEHWIPVPLDLFRWDTSSGAFVLDADSAMLQSAPFFMDGEFPDTTMEGWDSDFSSFWQSGGSGTGTGTNPTATP